MARDIRRLDTLEIDFAKNKFLLNGKPMDDIEKLKLDADGGDWTLEIATSIKYINKV